MQAGHVTDRCRPRDGPLQACGPGHPVGVMWQPGHVQHSCGSSAFNVAPGSELVCLCLAFQHSTRPADDPVSAATSKPHLHF